MAFQAVGTDYEGFLDQRRLADRKVTDALKAKGEAEKRARIRKSGQRSGLQKLVSAGVRGAAAYYTGGASETMGYGDKIDEAMLGTDEEGKAVRNEYGELVGAASQVGGAMSAKKGAEAAKKLEMQSLKDDAMQTRLDNLDPSGELGMNFAMKREKRDSANLEALQAGNKSSFTGLWQGDIEGINYEPTTVGDWEPQIQKNKGGLMNMGDAKTTSQVGSSTLRGLDTSSPTPDAPTVSAAQTYKTSSSVPTVETQAASEKDRIIAGLSSAPSEQRDPSVKDWGQEQGFIKNPEWNQYTNSQRATDEGSAIVPRRHKFMHQSVMPSANW